MSDPKRVHAHVSRLADTPPQTTGTGGFASTSRRLGATAGGRSLGCSHFEVAPGKTAFPMHFHCAIEEGVYVLEGTGTLRIGEDRIELAAGDYVALPPGPATAHQLLNTGTTPLRYLALSAPAAPATLDIVAYPDSNKVGFSGGAEPGKAPWLRKMLKGDQPSLDYYVDEPLAADGGPTPES